MKANLKLNRRHFLIALPLLAAIAAAPVAYAEPSGATIVVTHKVENLENWRWGYDSTANWKGKFGWKHGTVLTAEGDQNNVTVIEEFETMEKAKAFASSPELKAAMGKAGVIGVPDIPFFNSNVVSKP